VAAPFLNQDMGFASQVENLSVQWFIPKSGVQTFAAVILPWWTWRNEGCFAPLVPIQCSRGDKTAGFPEFDAQTRFRAEGSD